MFRNYFLTAYRNLLRHKGFSFLNIAGLTLGLTACLLIGLFVYDELQYDKFLPEGDRIYRIYNDQTAQEAGGVIAPVPPMFAVTFQESIPENEAMTRVFMTQFEAKNLVEAGDKRIYETGMMIADPNFFEIFQLPFIYGSPDKALDDPASVVISDKFSERFFGSANPLGRSVTINKQTVIVKGVFSTANYFHLPANFVLPLAAAELPAERSSS